MDYDVDLDFADDSTYVSYDDMQVDYATSFSADYSLTDLWSDCLWPTVYDGFYGTYVIFLCCALLRFTCFLGFLPPSVIHLTSGVCGLYCLHHLFGSDFVYIVVLASLGCFCIFFTYKAIGKYTGIICTGTCFLFLMSCEFLIETKSAWHKIRGSQMVLAMKLISLAFDVDNGNHVLPPIEECFGYLFSVGTVIFGPWVSFHAYSRILHPSRKHLMWALRIIKSSLLAFLFLTISTCWTAWFFEYTTWKWIGAYRDALSFRSSHYFVSYLSEALAVMSGISGSSDSWGLAIARPGRIEIPRSLVEVVTNWNLPIHFWLKNYVFKTAKPLGNFTAVLLTYVASSLLHGLNFQLAAVLLSLGFYTYIEYVLRVKLAVVFNACILARKCKRDCGHKYKDGNLYVVAANLIFGCLSVFHLAYLGVMFDSSSSIQEEGYSMRHTLQKWSDLNFASHWVSVATYVFYMLA